jgi:hypothetical protein
MLNDIYASQQAAAAQVRAETQEVRPSDDE